MLRLAGAVLLVAALLVLAGPLTSRGDGVLGATAHAAACRNTTATAKYSDRTIVATVVTTWCYRKGNVITRRSVPSAHPTTLGELLGLRAGDPKLQSSGCHSLNGYTTHNCSTRWQFSFNNIVSPFAPSIGVCLHSRIYGNGSFRRRRTTDCSTASTSALRPPNGATTADGSTPGEVPTPGEGPAPGAQPSIDESPPPPTATPAAPATSPQPAANSSSTTLPGDGSYAAMSSDHSSIVGCDRDSDGHRAYLRRYDIWGSPYPTVYDPDGAGGACAVVTVNDWPLGSYNICVQQEGCATPVRRSQF